MCSSVECIENAVYQVMCMSPLLFRSASYSAVVWASLPVIAQLCERKLFLFSSFKIFFREKPLQLGLRHIEECCQRLGEGVANLFFSCYLEDVNTVSILSLPFPFIFFLLCNSSHLPCLLRH